MAKFKSTRTIKITEHHNDEVNLKLLDMSERLASDYANGSADSSTVTIEIGTAKVEIETHMTQEVD